MLASTSFCRAPSSGGVFVSDIWIVCDSYYGRRWKCRTTMTPLHSPNTCLTSILLSCHAVCPTWQIVTPLILATATVTMVSGAPGFFRRVFCASMAGLPLVIRSPPTPHSSGSSTPGASMPACERAEEMHFSTLRSQPCTRAAVYFGAVTAVLVRSLRCGEVVVLCARGSS